MSITINKINIGVTKGTINCNSSSLPMGVEEEGVDRDVLLFELEEHLLEELEIGNEELAHTLAKELNDEKSLGFYRLLTATADHGVLNGALSSTLQADNSKMIRTTKPIYFQGILKKLGIQTKFKH